MNPASTGHILNFEYEKRSDEIVAKAAAKADALEAKVKERRARVARLREEHGITDAVLVDLLRQAREAQRAGGGKMSYTVSQRGLGNGVALVDRPLGGATDQQEVVVGAGTVNNLLTEGDFIEAETREAARLRTIARNLADLRDDAPNAPTGARKGHKLTREELEYLGF